MATGEPWVVARRDREGNWTALIVEHDEQVIEIEEGSEDDHTGFFSAYLGDYVAEDAPCKHVMAHDRVTNEPTVCIHCGKTQWDIEKEQQI